MAGTFVTRLKSPFLRSRRCRNLKVGSNENQFEEVPSCPGDCEKNIKHAISPPIGTIHKTKVRSPGIEKYITTYSLQAADKLNTQPSAGEQPLGESKRRKSGDSIRRRRRRTFECRDASLQALFRDTESELPNHRKLFCAAPLMRKLSELFGKKRAETVKGMGMRQVSCSSQGMEWNTTSPQKKRTSGKQTGYKLFSKRKRSITLVKYKKDTPLQEPSAIKSTSDDLKRSPRRTLGRELLSPSPISLSVTLARSEEACPYVLEDTPSVYNDRMHSAETTAAANSPRLLPPTAKEQALCPKNCDYEDEDEDDDDDLGMEEDDSYLRKYAGQPQSVGFSLRPRRYCLAPSRFQREHLERLRNAAKVSPSRRNSEDG